MGGLSVEILKDEIVRSCAVRILPLQDTSRRCAVGKGLYRRVRREKRPFDTPLAAQDAIFSWKVLNCVTPDCNKLAIFDETFARFRSKHFKRDLVS